VSRCALFGRLAEAERVVQISAPAGSGKTVLMRSWIAEAGLATRAAWVPVDSEERDPRRFWMSVAGALRDTTAGSALVRELTGAPDLDGWAMVERLLKDLAALEDRVWLVVDDVHELGSAEALRQLELLLMRGPPALRVVLATRQDVRLGLHRLRLEGDLAEIRAHDLRFTVDEARELLQAAGAELSDSALAPLVERTEGWAAGLRLAALSLVGTGIRSGSRKSFPVASGRWRSICWPRCWNVSRRKSGGCCCGPLCWSGSMASSPMP
jgi:LuxR family maltose regulon positive regulatory protein